jgi:hypothetical protein
MADTKEMRIFSAEQIEVPETLPDLLKNYSKEVIRSNPADIFKFSREYFESILKEQSYDFKNCPAVLSQPILKPVSNITPIVEDVKEYISPYSMLEKNIVQLD